MKDYSSFNTSIFTSSNVPAELFRQYGRMRYNCFSKNDPYVNLDHDNQIEFDHFDRDDHTKYIMVYTSHNGVPVELLSAVRVRSTIQCYELEMPSYRYLTKTADLPKDNTIYEASRWVGKSSRTTEGMLSTAMLVFKLYHLSHELAFRELIGTISTISENWLAKRSAKTERKSDTFHSERDNLDILISRIRMDETFLEVANKLLHSALKEVNFEQISVAQPALKRAA